MAPRAIPLPIPHQVLALRQENESHRLAAQAELLRGRLAQLRKQGEQLRQIQRLEARAAKEEQRGAGALSNRCPDIHCLDGGSVTNNGADVVRRAAGGVAVAAVGAAAGDSVSGGLMMHQQQHRPRFGTTPIEHRHPSHPTMQAVDLRLRALRVRARV